MQIMIVVAFMVFLSSVATFSTYVCLGPCVAIFINGHVLHSSLLS